NPSGLINLTKGSSAAAGAQQTAQSALARATDRPYSLLSTERGVDRLAMAIRKSIVWEARWWLRGRASLGSHRVPAGMSNTCTMSQPSFRSEASSSGAVNASTTRMGNDENRPGGTSGPTTSVITKVKPKTKRPNLYRVLILNDDYTPMEFVVLV